MTAQKDIWVFGYASLMWQPDFDFIERHPALLFGFHRALCVYSYLYRGTRDKPGLVAGLLPGGSCKGVAFRVAEDDWEEVHRKLHEREMVYEVYIPKWMQADIQGNRQQVFGYIANPENDQYAGDINEEEIARLISEGIGTSGTGQEYLENTIKHLRELGIRDQKLERVLAALK
ncbi:MAG: gamma-glutamylcyclotransferase [Rhodospirillaceae bacterium]|jgi:glutathione-specific gamma-glutamylcyclotransferase|nr:gamma-glutamylcyclotransferase [Rhodospirillaceae bacterium]MBT4589966.1 gamma-glutamylcyclotransferase [Rhodospirillaceae bacterium]MBT4938745.1 gamma-glutamylcyclotransferase [Rhodospirillaceae bacterium]MBT5938809.1 gamma-glutamylcyclotransferase [Rhodospirillaceae bacterium]MBT7265321.1 gamma-glutamylcyclotransferase [Rhodospirillaceae bacterium]